MKKNKQRIFIGVFFKNKEEALRRAGKMEVENGVEYGVGTCDGGFIVLTKEELDSVIK